MPKTVACKCPNCGAAISVQPVNGMMKCDYCQGAIQVKADEEGGVSLSVKHINIQGGTVQIADNLTVVQGDTAVTCSFCGRHNLKHNTFLCQKCKVDDLCIDHQSASGICKWCHEEEIADAKRRREEAEAEADRREEAEIAEARSRRALQKAEAKKRQTKVGLIVLGVISSAAFLVCCLVPVLVWMVSAISEIPRTAWITTFVICFAAILAIGVIAGAVWYLRNMQRETDTAASMLDSAEVSGGLLTSNCPACGYSGKVPSSKQGKSVRCPRCKEPFRVVGNELLDDRDN